VAEKLEAQKLEAQKLEAQKLEAEQLAAAPPKAETPAASPDELASGNTDSQVQKPESSVIDEPSDSESSDSSAS
jgi:hypothetical protein